MLRRLQPRGAQLFGVIALVLTLGGGCSGTTPSEPPAPEELTDAGSVGTDAGVPMGEDAGTPVVDEAYEITGKTYFLDAVAGDDTRDGLSRETAWRTLQKALETLQSGDGVLMRSGEYGGLTEREPPGRTDWITFKADEGQQPVLTRISLRYDAPTETWIRIDGVAVRPEWVDPVGDPQDPEAGSSTYVKTANPFGLENAAHVALLNSELTGTNKYLTMEAIDVDGSTDVLVAGVHGRRTWGSVFITGSERVVVKRSLFHEGVGSCVRLQPGNRDVVIDGVHCRDFNWSESDDYCTRGQNSPHGSAVAIRSGHITIRNSMFHDGWGSSGIMLYDGDHGQVAVYDDVLLENNVVYDINNDYPLRIYGLGRNVVVRNNLLVGKYRMVDGEITNDGRYRYGAAMALHQVAEGSSPAELKLHNNILIGAVLVSPEASEHHNLIWSTQSGGTWRCDGGEGTVIATCTYGNHPTLFESGFFAGPVNFAPGHNGTIDFQLAFESVGINAGDATDQPSHGKGALDPAGFIRPEGVSRSDSRHSVGPYEFE